MQRTFREIMFLQELDNHDNIIRCEISHLTTHRLPKGSLSASLLHHALAYRLLNVTKAENERDIYLVFEYMETDLHAVLRANILEDVHKRYIMYQLFRALKYLHSAELLHRDVKVRSLQLPTASPTSCMPRSATRAAAATAVSCQGVSDEMLG